jgi:hypothetical protein
MKGETKPPRPPEGLNDWAKGVWADLHRLHVFERHEEIALERALRWWTTSDAWLRESETAGPKDQGRLVKQAVDASTQALRAWRGLKFPAAPGEPARRPGRPSGPDWSPDRKAKYDAWRQSMTETRGA